MVKSMMYQMFFMSNDLVTVLKIFLENFAKNGLETFQGKNVVFSIKHILTLCGCLAEVQQLPTETTTHILSGFIFSKWINSNNLLGYF